MEEQDEKYWQGFYALVEKKPEEWLNAVKAEKVEVTGDNPTPEFYLSCLRHAGVNE